MSKRSIKFIDLFAGIGGIRLGLEAAFHAKGIETECVLVSEIKPFAIKSLQKNFGSENFAGNICKIENDWIPDFDILLGGFPCQPFSASGKRLGFVDTRGTLFFEIERILEAKQPYGFILENVEGLLKHDLENKSDKIGKTLKTILAKLKGLGYKVSYEVLDAIDFGLPQSRKRVFIVGTKNSEISLEGFVPKHQYLESILEQGLPTKVTSFTKKLLKEYSLEELPGKSIIDKRGGANNIHSWDINLKGKVSKKQKELLNKIFTERRKKQWAKEFGIHWMDGMPLTFEQINSFFSAKNLQEMLDDLEAKGYLKLEHPKDLITEKTENGIKKYRKYNTNLPKGYNIVTGKLSFEINKILHPKSIAPTLVATDVSRIAVVDGDGLRKLSVREGLRLFGYPEWFELPVSEKEAFDLLGNTVAMPVVKAIADRIAEAMLKQKPNHLTTKEVPVFSS